MIISPKIIKVWFILFLPFFVFKMHGLYKQSEENEEKYGGLLKGYVGSKFPIDNFIDRNGRDVKIDLGKSKLTVIDFWFDTCPPCIEDMNKFPKLIVGHDTLISVVSVSVNSFEVWNALFKSKDKKFAILSKPINNWKHVVLKSNEDPALNNPIPADNIELIKSSFQSHSFPMYFVLDRTGTIQATPFSLSRYIELNVFNRNSFLYYLTNAKTWTSDYSLIPMIFIEYSGYFWIVCLLGIWLWSMRKKKQQLNSEPGR